MHLQDLINHGELTAPGQRYHKQYTWLRVPHSVKWKGKLYDLATDGCIMVLAPYSGKYEPLVEPDSNPPLGVLKKKGNPIGKVSLSQLREFAGRIRWSVPCEECNGTGQYFTESRSGKQRIAFCYNCEGEGDKYPDARDGIIADRPINTILLARALACLPIDDVSVTIELAEDMFIFHSTHWIITLMAMRSHSGYIEHTRPAILELVDRLTEVA